MTSASSPDVEDRERTLETLVWDALTTTHARFAEGGDLARRYHPEVAGFVATRDASPASWAALAALVRPDESVMLSGRDALAHPREWTRQGGGRGFQMILRSLSTSAPVDATIVRLTKSDVDQMLALIERTRPGPFRPRTIELGNYYGVFDDGRLVAMAGERLQTEHFTEISAVCTHPDARARGLATALSRHVAIGILERGQTPILHVAEHNDNARRIYERLGFVVRGQLEFVATRPPAVRERVVE